MKAEAPILAGGGSVRASRRPRFRLFFLISLLWLPVAFLGAIAAWAGKDGELAKPGWLLVALEPVFLALAVLFRLTESPREVWEQRPPPPSAV